ncbi:hypothetical protein [Streptomyces sp. NPDC004726]
MPSFGRDRRRFRLPATVTALLGTVFALLLLLCPAREPAAAAVPAPVASPVVALGPASASGPGSALAPASGSALESGPASASHAYGPDARTVLTAPAGIQDGRPGCDGNGTADDHGTQPSAPPRAAAHEPPPAAYDVHRGTDPALTPAGAGLPPEGRPPSLPPPSPEELSILRV